MTGVTLVHLMHCMEGLQQPLPVLIEDILPNPPLDPKPNELQQLPGPEDVPSNPTSHYDLVSKSQPEPVPESLSVARRHISLQDSHTIIDSDSIIVSPKKKHRNNDVFNLHNSNDYEPLLEVNDINDKSSDGKVSGHNDPNLGNDDDNKKMPAI